MNHQLEVSAKSVDEAIELALKQLDAERDEVEIEVLSRGKSGILGFGAEPARVRATLIRESRGVGSVAKELVDHLVNHMGLALSSYLKSSGQDDQGTMGIELEGEDSGLIIGRRGETLRSFQFLVNYLLARQLQERAFITVDVEHYKERRHQALESRARRLAERVVSSGRPFSLEPMSAAERRVVHLALADHPRVTTQSVGDGEQRKVTIVPRPGADQGLQERRGSQR